MKDKYVLDSNIWIEIERKNAVILEVVLPLIQKNEVCLVDLIVAELLRGTKTKKDFIKLKTALNDFTQLTTSWENVAKLAFRVSRKDFNPPLIDLYIATCIMKHHKTLITSDKHFKQIAQVKSFELIFV